MSVTQPAPQPNAAKQGGRNWPALGAGIFLLALATALVVFTVSNPMAWAIGWFAFLCGIGLIMMGALDVQSKNRQQDQAPQRPVVRIRCMHCNSLNLETSLRCENCGARL